MIHPKTGHECRLSPPDLWGDVPHEVTIHIKPGHNFDDKHRWYAYIMPTDHKCECEDECECLFDVGWLTDGDSPANAIHMAFDLMSTYWEECSADKEGNVPHCWCVDTVYSFPWEDHSTRFVKCCRCDHHASLAEFE